MVLVLVHHGASESGFGPLWVVVGAGSRGCSGPRCGGVGAAALARVRELDKHPIGINIRYPMH